MTIAVPVLALPWFGLALMAFVIAAYNLGKSHSGPNPHQETSTHDSKTSDR